MDRTRKTKDQRRAERREQVRIELAQQKKRERRNSLLTRGGVTLGFLALFAAVGYGLWQSSRPKDQTGPANMLSGGVVFTGAAGKTEVVKTASMPSGGDAVPTATTSPARIVTYIDFSCEYCKAFEGANGDQIEKMVADGKASLEVVPVAILGDYSVRAASAASCLAAEQPESFFPMLKVMYDQQPAEGGPGLTNEEILDLWKSAGINASSATKDCVEATRYSDWIKTRTEVVTSDSKVANPATGGFGTPTVFVNDVRYQPKNLSDPTEFAAFVTANSDKGATSSPSPTS